MEDIVAVKVTDGDGKLHYFMTWGRVFDAVDPKPLYKALRPYLSRYGVRDVKEMNLCLSLQEASGQPYFYEAFFRFSQKPIPFGKGYEAWKKEKKKEIRKGNEIRYLGINRGARKLAEESTTPITS